MLLSYAVGAFCGWFPHRQGVLCSRGLYPFHISEPAQTPAISSLTIVQTSVHLGPIILGASSADVGSLGVNPWPSDPAQI